MSAIASKNCGLSYAWAVCQTPHRARHDYQYRCVLREVCPLPAPNWSRPLPRPIIIPDVMELATLGDLRILVEKHLPKEYRSKFTWRQFRPAGCEVSTALRIVLQLEGAKCQ